jgi:hypothetical protein
MSSFSLAIRQYLKPLENNAKGVPKISPAILNYNSITIEPVSKCSI